MTKEIIDTVLEFDTIEALQCLLNELSSCKPQCTLMMEQSAVKVAGKIGFVNWGRCEIITQPVYDAYFGEYSYENPFVCVKQEDRWGVLNYEGCEEVPPCCTKRIAVLMRAFLIMHISVNVKDEDPLLFA